MNKPYFCRNFFLTDWRHERLKNTIDLLLFYGEYFYGFSESVGSLGILKEKPTRKTCFSHEKKRLARRIYQAKFCLAAFLWSQRNLYYIFTQNRC